jgi:hypothetical protein
MLSIFALIGFDIGFALGAFAEYKLLKRIWKK